MADENIDQVVAEAIADAAASKPAPKKPRTKKTNPVFIPAQRIDRNAGVTARMISKRAITGLSKVHSISVAAQSKNIQMALLQEIQAACTRLMHHPPTAVRASSADLAKPIRYAPLDCS